MSFALKLQNVLNKLRTSELSKKNNLCEIQKCLTRGIFGKELIYYGSFDNNDGLFQIKLEIQFPCGITPKRDENGFVFLYSNGCQHPIVTNNYVNVRNLQDWFRDELDKMKYYSEDREAWEATKLNLVPAFEFTWNKWPLDWTQKTAPHTRATDHHSWFAVPYTKWGSSDESTFIVCSPSREAESVGCYSDNFNDVLFLMKVLRDTHVSDLPLTNYMLKTVLLHQLPKVNWKKDLGTLLIDMWKCLVDHLRSGRLELHLTNEINIFDCMNAEEVEKCYFTANRLLSELCRVKNNGYPYNLNNIFQVQ